MIKWLHKRTWSIKEPIIVAPFAVSFCLTAYYFTALNRFLFFVILMVLATCLGITFDVVDAIQKDRYDSIDSI